MMPATFGSGLASVQHVGYPMDTVLDDLSRQIASAASRRLSRGSNGQRAGGAMRVMKPSSANNSPRSSIMQARRRTLMNDGALARRNVVLQEQGYLSTPAADEMSAASIRTARPVSWHPSSHLLQTPALPQPAVQYPFPPYSELELLTQYHQFPPTPAAYSGYTSPSSAFSPLSLPYSGFEAPQYFSPSSWALSASSGSNSIPSPTDCQPWPQQTGISPPQATQTVTNTTAEWNSFAAHGFDRCTAPPTPDNFPVAAKPEPKLPAEEAIPFEPLEEDEPEGEILIGMGLYDPPEKEITDPTLESYRASVAHLLGSAYKYPEPTGKGLKLEDAWEPPEMNDEDDEEQSGDQDADGDDQDEE